MDNIPSSMKSLRDYLIEAEEKIKVVKLDYSPTDVSKVIDSDAWELHFNHLYKNYIKKYNAGDHSEFIHGGWVLHQAYFGQLCKYDTSTMTTDVKDLIQKKFGTYKDFKEEFTEQAVKFHGSGWIYLSVNGSIKTIVNHKPVFDIAFIMDLWEHAYVDTFRGDRKKYINDMWKIINWETVSDRIKNKTSKI